MIKAILVEDESYIRKGLATLIESLDKKIMVLAECGSVKDAKTIIPACKPDLVFLDINLPDGTAFELLEQLGDTHFMIIFITAYDEYALKALKLGAVDYILKPVDIEELETAIDKVLHLDATKQQQQIQIVKDQFNDKRLVVSLQEGYQIINLDELTHCKSDKGYTTFYLANGKTVIASKSIKYFLDKLSTERFVRPHQSYVVNLDFVDRFDKGGMIILKSGQSIPVSLRKREEFLSFLLDKG